jgi:predicted NAD/FAD-dependent oxidoreductase
MFENSDLTLTVTSSLSGNVAANSDVSIIVPAPELVKLLDNPVLKADRDREIKSLAP